jgi:SAM-dependent methyltransferase
MKATAEFDQFADTYAAELNHALSVSGEDKDYYARGRVSFLASCLRHCRETPHFAMDYGCGVGGTVPLLRKIVGVEHVIGIDTSERLLGRAQEKFGSNKIAFQTIEQYRLTSVVDLAYCNGVFHHIPVDERDSALRYIYRSLRLGGVFAFWENNPWSPAARYVMARCAFDRNAVMLTSLEARRMLRAAGFQILRTDFCFYFPHRLRVLRIAESGLTSFPLGAQYQILCRKPA